MMFMSQKRVTHFFDALSQKTIYALRPESFCALNVAIRKVQTFWASDRARQHHEDVEGKKESNAFFKHLQIFHPAEEGGIENFDIQVQSVHKKSLTRQKTEAVKIQSSTADHLLNSKAEHRQPALLRVKMTRENNNDDLPRQGRGGDGAHQPARRRGGN